MTDVRTAPVGRGAAPAGPAAAESPALRPNAPGTAARRRAAALPPACAAAFLLLAGAGAGIPSAARAQTAPSAAREAECAGLIGGRRLTYRNPRYGFVMTYPSAFELDPTSVPDSGDSARFWTYDRRATAVVTGLRNGMGQTLAELLREARQDIAENGHGTITYERARAGWFVLSGYVADRIYYRRTFLSHDAQVIGTLWIEFPRHLKPCLEDAVTMMSLSFRPGGT